MYIQHKSQRKLGSYPTIHIILGIMLALLVVGLLGLFMLHANRLTSMIRENVNIQVYLHKHITESEIVYIEQLLRQKGFVQKQDGHAQLKFVSKEEVAQDFTDVTGEDFLQVLDENPLRDFFSVCIAPDYQYNEQLQAIKQDLEAIRGVFEVDYMVDLITSVSHNMTRVGAILTIFSFILLLVVIVLINNTIKLAIYAQRFLIRSMHLVGATASFIRRPFLMRAILMGAMAATMANILLVSALHFANQQIDVLVKIQEPMRIFMLLGSILVLGVLVSMMSTHRSVNKYLHSSLNDLY